MLKQLLIRNYALIEHLELNPSPELNIITGETGAGKSIMIGAVGLLLGNRADTKVLLNLNEKCVIEGTFDIAEYSLESLFDQLDLDLETETILRREINPSGKSRAFINDSPVNLDTLKRVGEMLMDVHSQNDVILLESNAYQLNIIDCFAGQLPLFESYQSVFHDFNQHQSQLNRLLEESDQIQKEADYHHFLWDELDKSDIRPGEIEELKSDVKMLEHTEEIKTRLGQALDFLAHSEYSIQNQLFLLDKILSQLSSFSERFESSQSRVQSLLEEVKDLIQELGHEEEEIEFNPDKAKSSQERLSFLYTLQQKHKVQTEQELLQIKDELTEKIERVTNLEGEINDIASEVDTTREKLKDLAARLSKHRRKAFVPISVALARLLADIGMPEASVEIGHENQEPNSSGIDRIEFLFSANKGIAPQPLRKVASGGEFSRLMFSLKYILADKAALPTIVFDEIDSGISGEIANKMAIMMQQMAQRHQVITISHLPQIAAMGDDHYFVYKDSSQEKSVSKIKRLNEEERILEIAKMLSGDSPSEVAFKNARELIYKTN